MPVLARPAAALAAALLVSACVTMPQSIGEASMFYRDYAGPPPGAPRALMRLSADGVIRITPRSRCADFAKPETGVALFSTFSLKDYKHLHGRTLGVVGSAPPGITSTEVALEAGQPVVLSFTRNWTERGTAYTCQLHRTFTPEADAQYQLLAEPVFAEQSCRVLVARLSAPVAPVALDQAPLCGR